MPEHTMPWLDCKACFPADDSEYTEALTAIPVRTAREHMADTRDERRTLRGALEGDRTGAQQTPRRGTGSWVRLPGKMSKTRFDAPRSVPPILPLEGWLWVSLAMQAVMLACVVWLEFQR